MKKHVLKTSSIIVMVLIVFLVIGSISIIYALSDDEQFDGVAYYDGSNLYNDEECNNIVTDTSEITKVIVKDGVESIPNGAFGYSEFESIIIPDSLTSIGNGAFFGSDIKSIILPENVTSIGIQTFYDCSHLKTITILSDNISYGGSDFVNVTLDYINTNDDIADVVFDQIDDHLRKSYTYYKVSYDLNGNSVEGDFYNVQFVRGGKAPNLPVLKTSENEIGVWNTKADGTGLNYDDKTVINDDITLYANIIRFHNVSFDSNGGDTTPADLEGVRDNTTISQPKTPTKPGYTFAGWYKDVELATEWDFDNDVVVEDITLYAKWTPNTYDVTYVLNGGSNHVDNADTYTYGVGFALGTPTKLGHTFAGWYKESDFSGTQVTEITSNDINEVTLYAKWTPNTYDVTYVLNGGSNHVDNADTYTYGVGFALNAPTKLGHTFEGWYKESDFSGTPVTEITSNDIDEVTLYAKWTPNTYNVTYVLNGGSNHVDNADTYTYGVGFTLSAPTKVGHTFEGWYKESDFSGTPVTEITSNDIEDITLYAKWTPNTYNVTYVLNGGSNHVDNTDTYTYGIGFALNAPTKLGHTFEGWYKESDFSGTQVTEITSNDIDEVTLYAKWTPNTYDMTYVLNGGSNHVDNTDTYTYGVGFTLNAPTKLGHTFAGWYKESDFSGTQVTEITAEDIGDIALYTKWIPNTYDVTYVLNGGSNHVDNADTYTYGVGFALGTPTKLGHTFAGWHKESDFSGTPVTEITAEDIGDIALYAKWTPNSYKVTYVLDGGVNDENNGDTYTYGEGFTLQNPTKDGYIFGGWYKESDISGLAITEISSTDIGDITLYAKWTKKEDPVSVEVIDDAPKTTLQGSDNDIIDAVLTDEEKENEDYENNSSVKLLIEKADSSTVDDKLFQVVTSDKTLGLYLDISLYKNIEGVEEQVTQTNAPIKITIDIPQELRDENRIFFVLRVHDGEVTVLEDIDDDSNTITFETDKFSTYAIAYEDTSITPNPGTGTDYPPFVALVMLLSSVTLAVIQIKRKSNR